MLKTVGFPSTRTGNQTIVDGNLVVGTAGKGIDFSANGGDVLTQYDEGTFTPTVYGTTSAGTGTYNGQGGYYTRIGNAVNFTLYLSWTAHTGTGNIRVGGLPFAPSSSALKGFSAFNVWSNILARTAGEMVQALSEAGQTYIVLSSTNLTTGQASSIPMDTDAVLCISGTYFV